MPDDEAQRDSEAGEPEATTDQDTLRRLEQRLDRASETAERLIAEAAQRATRRPPPAGWQEVAPDGDQAPGGDHAPGGDRPQPGAATARPDSLLGGETDLLLSILAGLRDRIPPELQQRLADAVREVLLALRALIDWYLERNERRRAQPVEVQDIPIL